MRAGFDLGSRNIGAVLIDDGRIVQARSVPHNGAIPAVLGGIIRDFRSLGGIEQFGVCGGMDLEGLKVIDPILASVEANRFLKTGACNILSIGCETFYLVLLDENGDYVEHSVNPLCASGTGSFLDQQAERIGLTAEELAEMACGYSGRTPSIAIRCAVFAKSDIIHSQAEGFSREAIAAGLCEGMARSVLASLVRGRTLSNGVLFVGGVSLNRKMVSEIGRLLGGGVRTSPEGAHFNAVGAAVLGRETVLDAERICAGMTGKRETREKLELRLTDYPDFGVDKTEIEDGIEITEYAPLDGGHYRIYLGIDIGSTSTKALVMDRDGAILLGLYTRTAGEPVAAVQRLLGRLSGRFSGTKLEVMGAGTTGSGRKLVREVLNADLEVNEITAHAKGALFIDPAVDTIIEIGGQDSKFTVLKDGAVVSSVMNYVCAAGTGSFIEEQAKRLGITLDEISGMAIGQSAPFTSDRCTVYMERDLNTFLSEGWDKKQVIASVLFSVRDNYLSKVVGKTPMGNRVFFQGATARNRALVAAFESEVKKPVLVSRFCHLTGALGVAVLLREKGPAKSSFTGVDFQFASRQEICGLCVNRCALSVYEVNGRTVAWGLKCGRDYENRKAGAADKASSIEKAFAEIFRAGGAPAPDAKTAGVPAALYLSEYYPLFRDFLETLGFAVTVGKSSPARLREGNRLINSDFCAPMVMAHGIAAALGEKKPGIIFMPAIVNDQDMTGVLPAPEKYMDKTRDGYFCYYSSYAPTVIGNLTALRLGERLVSPKISFNNRDIRDVAEELARDASAALGLPEKDIAGAFLASWGRYQENRKKWKAKGAEILKGGGLKVVLLGRPYSVLDSAINMGIPAGIEEGRHPVVYQSMLDVKAGGDWYINRFLPKMHWHYGQEVLLAAEYAARTPGLYPVFLTCFRCSPDAYLITYIKEIFQRYDKPYLIVQLDEHTSDVGYQTRLEAAFETFRNDFNQNAGKKPAGFAVRRPKNDEIRPGDAVLVPFISPVISGLYVEAFQAHGYRSLLLPIEQKYINAGYRYASGCECMPNVAIIGSLVETVKKEKLDPARAVLYLPTICMACNFNQYSILAELALEKEGLEKVRISNGVTLKQIPGLPKELNVAILEINILGSLLYKLYYRYHPYAPEAAGRAMEASLEAVRRDLRAKKSLMEAARETRVLFEGLHAAGCPRRPRVFVLGDLYAKYNSVLNQDIYALVEELGAEAAIPSYTETIMHFLDADVRENGQDPRYRKGLALFEKQFERIFRGMLDGEFEPSHEECNSLAEAYGIRHFLAGETAMNAGRALYSIRNGLADAIVHLNPVFCCPGVVTSSLFRKVQKDLKTPIIDIFYDGTNRPNRAIIPQLYYLTKGKK